MQAGTEGADETVERLDAVQRGMIATQRLVPPLLVERLRFLGEDGREIALLEIVEAGDDLTAMGGGADASVNGSEN